MNVRARIVHTGALIAVAALTACGQAQNVAADGVNTPPAAQPAVDGDLTTNYGRRIKTWLIDRAGRRIGTVWAWQAQRGVLLELAVSGLEPGAHGLHLHAVGICSDIGAFKRSGGHVSSGQAHGFLHPDGPHPGDLPNLYVARDGSARLDVFTTLISLDQLTDADGAALVIHETRDDYQTAPIGNSGSRVACAEFSGEAGARASDGGLSS